MTSLIVLATILTLTLWSMSSIKAQGFPFSLEFEKFDANQSNMFNFLGQARTDSVSQTLQLSDPTDVNCQTSPCVGQVFFSQPVQVKDPVTNRTYSFSTSFTFTITSPMRFRTGDGFVFLLATNPLPIPVGAGTFGCFPPNSGKSVTPIVAVEFDTSMNSYLYDINDNHVGIDINYAQSVKASDAGILSVKLSSGLLITSWIDYHHMYKLIEVRLSYYRVGASKPVNPFFTLPLDLSRSWTPNMYVGFSTQIYHGSEQSCNIFSWSFTSYVETTLPPPPPSPSLPPPPPTEFTESGNSTWGQKTVELGKLIGVAVGAFVLLAGVCGATVGYARFGCSVAADPADLLDPNESLSTDTRKKEDGDDDLEENVSADVQGSTRRTPSRGILGFGDMIFTNALYAVSCVGCSGDHITETASTYSTEIAETTVKGEAEEITGFDSSRAPLQKQLAFLLETARAGVEDCIEAERFTFKELNEATDNFSESLQLGEGRYGVFYGGILANGVQVAVKSLTALKNQNTQTFKAEVSILYRLRHPNLVGLHGWCKRSQDYFLVYDLISNGNLSRLIFQKGSLPWPERFKIIQNVADALEYLHKRHTLHRNVKTTNIFLAGDNDGKVGDFGLAWLMDHDEDKGTKGYVAPEVRITHRLTKQTDVFAFGIVTLEILCERPFYEPDADPDAVYLVNLVSTLVDSHTLRKAVPKDVEDIDDPLMTLVANLGLLCCDGDPLARPSMKGVVQCLAGNIPFPPAPESPDKETSPSYNTTSTTERRNSIAATAPKRSSGSTSSPESLRIDTTPLNKTTFLTWEKNTTVASGSKKSPGSNISPVSPWTDTNLPHNTTPADEKKGTPVVTAPKKTRRSTDTTRYQTSSTTEKKNKTVATISKKRQRSISSPKSQQIVSSSRNRTTSTTQKKNSTVDSASKKSPGSTSSTTDPTPSTVRVPRSNTEKDVDAIVLSSEQQTTSAGTGLTPPSEINKGIPSPFPQVSAPNPSLDPVLARKEPLVRVASASAVDLDLRSASAPSDSSLELGEDNSSKTQAVPTFKVESDISSTPNISDEVKSSPAEPESHVFTTHGYCYSLLEELVSILLNYIDVDDDDTLSDTLDTEAFQSDESRTISEKPPGPPLRPPPDPPFRPPPIPPPVPPPRRPPPSPSPIPEPDPPSPIPGPIPRRPPPLRRPPPPRGPPQPPPPQGAETLAQEVPAQSKGQALKLGTMSESFANPQERPRKKPTSKSDQRTEISSSSRTASTFQLTSQEGTASQDQEPRSSLSIPTTKKTPSPKTIKSKAEPPERSTTKHGPTQSSAAEAPTQFGSSHLKLPSGTPPTSNILLPSSDLDIRARLAAPPTKTSPSPESMASTAKPREKSKTKTGPAPSSRSSQVTQPANIRTSQPVFASVSWPSLPLTPSTSNLDPRASSSTPPSKRGPTPEYGPSTKTASIPESIKGKAKSPVISSGQSGQPSSFTSPRKSEARSRQPEIQSPRQQFRTVSLPRSHSREPVSLSTPTFKNTFTSDSTKGEKTVPQGYTEPGSSVSPSITEKSTRARSRHADLSYPSPSPSPLPRILRYSLSTTLTKEPANSQSSK